MSDTGSIPETIRAKRGQAKPQGTGQLMQKVSEAATDLAKDMAHAVERLRHDAHRAEKKKDQVMAILQERLDIRGQVKRIWPLLSDSDQETLRNFGLQGPREGRS